MKELATEKLLRCFIVFIIILKGTSCLFSTNSLKRSSTFFQGEGRAPKTARQVTFKVSSSVGKGLGKSFMKRIIN